MMSAFSATPAYFFTLRIWMVKHGNDGIQWRARLHNIHTKEVTYHKDWQALIECIENTLENRITNPSSHLHPNGGEANNPD
jgi:hypothetical protein